MELEKEMKGALNHLAIQQRMEDQRQKNLIPSEEEESDFVGDDRHILTSRLVSQAQSRTLTSNIGINGEGNPEQHEPPVDPNAAKSDDTVNEAESGGDDVVRDEIIRELKKVQKQNFITHCLLSAMIVLTVAWQVSEFTLVFKLKHRLTSPFKSIGSMVRGMIKGRIEDAHIGEKESGRKQQQIEGPSHSPLQIPELPCLDLPLGLDSDES